MKPVVIRQENGADGVSIRMTRSSTSAPQLIVDAGYYGGWSLGIEHAESLVAALIKIKEACRNSTNTNDLINQLAILHNGNSIPNNWDGAKRRLLLWETAGRLLTYSNAIAKTVADLLQFDELIATLQFETQRSRSPMYVGVYRHGAKCSLSLAASAPGILWHGCKFANKSAEQLISELVCMAHELRKPPADGDIGNAG